MRIHEAPWEAKVLAIARPMPLEAPVTRAVFLASKGVMAIFWQDTWAPRSVRACACLRRHQHRRQHRNPAAGRRRPSHRHTHPSPRFGSIPACVVTSIRGHASCLAVPLAPGSSRNGTVDVPSMSRCCCFADVGTPRRGHSPWLIRRHGLVA